MAQQKISTPSVVDIVDVAMRASTAYAYPEVGGIGAKDPWDFVLTQLEPYALDPDNVVKALRASLSNPGALNPFLTTSLYEKRFGTRGFYLVGPTGSGADFEGSSGDTITAAISALGGLGGWIVLHPQVYTLASTLLIPPHVRLFGIHPEHTILKPETDIFAVELQQKSFLSRITVDGANISSRACISVGENSTVERCRIRDFECLGVQLTGRNSKIVFSRFDSSATNTYATAASFQAPQQVVEACSFHGPIKGGAVQLESQEGAVLNSFFAEDNVGASFYVPSPTLNDNRIVGCHFASALALSESVDHGTKTVRYGNTPSTANSQNFLDQLAVHTGQPSVASTEMVLGNSFTHDPETVKDATSLLSKVDEAVEQLFEERNYSIQVPDPTYDGFGNALTSFFAWDGSTNTLSWPAFLLTSLHRTDPIANIPSGSLVVPPGQKCFLDFNAGTSLATLTIVPNDRPLARKRLTLLTALPAQGHALWREGARLEANVVSHFDADGHLLSATRWLGLTDTRNPSRQTGLFASYEKPDMTTQLDDQSKTLRLLYERDNLQYNRETDDTRISTEPSVGDYYTPSVWASGIASAPTHLLNVQGTLYGLVPTSGIFLFDRSADGWRPVQGCPMPGPYASLSRWTTGLCLLSVSGSVVTYAPEVGWGATTTPTKSAPLAAVTLSPAGPNTPWYDAGQTDFAMQTQNYSLFTTVDGYSIRWYQDSNCLDLLPRIFTEAAGSSLGALSCHPKDTGYNMTVGLEDLCMDGGNGGFSRLSGLPLSRYFNAEILVDTQMLGREQALRIDWSTLVIENFAMTQPNGDFLVVASNASRSSFYVLVGGRGTARLASVLDVTTSMPGFTPTAWVLDVRRQTTYVLGPSQSSELICYKGVWSTPTLPSDQGWGAGRYTFTKTTVLPSGRCSGVFASLDSFNEVSGSGKLIALACDPARANRPTWVEYVPTTDVWTTTHLTNETPGSNTLQVAGAVANSLEPQASAGYGVASPHGMSFLIRAGSAYGGRPFILRRHRTTGEVQTHDLGGSSVTQCSGGVYHPAFKTVMWLMRGSADNVRVYSLFESFSTPTVWETSTIGSGGSYLTGLTLRTTTHNRSASMISRSANIVLGAFATYDVYLHSNRGLIKGSLGLGATGFSTQSWTLVNGRSASDPFVFSTTGNTYSCTIGGDRGGELSLQFASLAENLPVYGFSALSQPDDDYHGFFWFEPGTVVKNLGKSLWAGLNRGGYLWIAHEGQNKQVEFTPNAQVRGDVEVANMAAATDFDWALTPDGMQVGFCMRTSANNLFFYLYDVPTQSLSLERQGVHFNNVALLSSTPKMSFNHVLNAFEIVAQDNTRAGGQLLFYRRSLTGTWLGELVGSGSANLSSLGAQTCKTPCKPLILDDGSFLVACEGANATATLLRRSSAGWSISWQSSESGFSLPVVAKTNGSNPRYFIFGGTASGVRSAVGSSLSGVGSWSTLIKPTSQSVSVYTRVKAPEIYMTDDCVYVASPLASETGATDSQEFGVFRFSKTGDVRGSAFAAKGRIAQGQQSGQEEVGYNAHSFTYKGDLLYAATRPGRSQVHWSLRRSFNGWVCVGESVLGAGRIVALDGRQYRESFVSATQSDGFFVVDDRLRASFVFPLATRNEGELWGLNWATKSQGPLFAYGSFDSSFTSDTKASTGLLPALGQRPWPRILGSTQGMLSGASIFGHGSGLRLQNPLSTANYFGTTLPSNGLVRLKAVCSLTFYGRHRFRLGHRSDKEYVVDGPLTFPLSQSGETLVLDFATANSLKLDSSQAPLSYWVFGDISKYRYPVVLGRFDGTEFILSPILGQKRLTTDGHLEPRERSDLSLDLDSRSVDGYVPNTRFCFEEIMTGTYGALKIKILGTNHGLQTMHMTSSEKKQLIVRGPSAGGFTFLTSTTGSTRSASPYLQPVLTLIDNIILY